MNATLHPTPRMRDVPKHFDGGDIDGDGQWYGPDMSCLDCRATRPVRYTHTHTYLLAALECGNCCELFAEVWI